MTYDITFSQHGKVGLITLARPKALNALNLDMVVAMRAQLEAWAEDDAIAAVVVEGEGEKGFCAGGDIRLLQASGRDGTPLAAEFFTAEYRNNRAIATFPKPYVALIDGITMGGGVGISAHGRFRVLTEKTLWAMPETGIGLIPDVGASYILPRLEGHIGMYLGLTGARLKAPDAYYAGIGTHYVPSDKIASVKDALFGADFGSGAQGAEDAVAAVLAQFHETPDRGELETRRGEIDHLFGGETVEQIIAAMGSAGDYWVKQAEILKTKSPLSLKLTHRVILDGAVRTLDQCLANEYRVTSRIVASNDFQEGVRALIIDKDNSPRWDPPTLDRVDPMDVEGYFASLGDAELDLKP